MIEHPSAFMLQRHSQLIRSSLTISKMAAGSRVGAIIFDLDNTLIETNQADIVAYNEVGNDQTFVFHYIV